MSVWKRLSATFGGDAKTDEISQEMQFHLQMRIDEYIAEGASPAEAKRKAMVKFGNPGLVRDQTRDHDVLGWLDTFLREARHAYRNLRRRPTFALVAIVSLALGIGANTAIFSVVDSVILKPLPFEAADRVFGLIERKGSAPAGGNPQRVRDYEAQAKSFDSIAGYYGDSLLLTTGEREKVSSVRFFGDLLRVLRIRPELGRVFTESELRGEGAPVALINRSLWQRRFGSKPNLAGMQLQTKQGVFEVVGVLPASVTFPEDAQVWSPDQNFRLASRKAGWLSVAARLKDGVTIEQADAELRVIASQLARQYPDSDTGLSASLQSLNEIVAGEAKTPILLLMGTVSMVLLIACVNLAGLLLTRGSERQREATIRAAIGAGRVSLVRLFLMESLLLSVSGALLGLAFAWYAVEALKGTIPDNVPRISQVTLDPRALLFTLGLSIACALLFGLLPAWRASRVSLEGGLRDRAKSGGRTWLRGGMSIAQIALSMLLLILTGLLTRGFLNLRSRPLGFAPEHVVTISAPFTWDTPSATVAAFTDAALRNLGNVPGVRVAGVVDRAPLTGGTQSSKDIRFRKHQPPESSLQQEFGNRGVSPGYFRALGIPLRAGRMLDEWRGSAATARQVLVNEAFVRRYFGSKDPIGEQLSFEREGEKESTWWEIIGVTGDVPAAAGEVAPRAEVFRQIQRVGWPLLTFTLLVDGDPRQTIAAARKTLMDLDSTLTPEAKLMTMVIQNTWRQPSLLVTLMSGFSLCALVLALIGVYGLLASDVNSRTQEIGVRMALGAERGDVLWMALRRGLQITGAGITLGVGLALALGDKVRDLIFGVAPNDVFAIASAVSVLAVAAAIACYLPARRAASVDPIVALRYE